LSRRLSIAAYHTAFSYDFSVAQIYAEYQRQITVASREKTISASSALAPVSPPSNQILASWARDYITFGAAPHKTRDTASVAYDYVLSKRTDTYIAYSYDKASGLATANTLIAGIRHRF
jgi:predicted porin